MTIPNAEHFFEQAEKLTAPTGRGAARQTDLRRAVSSAYYGLFHAIMMAAADAFVGRTKRTSNEYALAYRSVDHRTLRELCTELLKPTLPVRYRYYASEGGFGPELKAVAAIGVELQRARYRADYDPLLRLARSDAMLAVSTARGAVLRFTQAPAAQRTVFLAFLLFPPR